jgi:hypothetical protein
VKRIGAPEVDYSIQPEAVLSVIGNYAHGINPAQNEHPLEIPHKDHFVKSDSKLTEGAAHVGC